MSNRHIVRVVASQELLKLVPGKIADAFEAVWLSNRFALIQIPGVPYGALCDVKRGKANFVWYVQITLLRASMSVGLAGHRCPGWHSLWPFQPFPAGLPFRRACGRIRGFQLAYRGARCLRSLKIAVRKSR